jgi:hypothetical protein
MLQTRRADAQEATLAIVDHPDKHAIGTMCESLSGSERPQDPSS